MIKNDALSQVRDLIELLERSELSRYSNAVIEAPAKLDGRDVISVTTARHGIDHTGRLTEWDDPDFFFSLENYILSVRSGDYAVILRDGALLQIRFDFQGNDLVGHRLCYFPMPCFIDEDFLDQDGPAEVLELVMEQEPSRIRLRTPLRFDYNSFNSVSDPEVHLHLVKDDGRLPVFGPLSLRHFVSLVFGTFYPKDYGGYEFLRARPSLIKRTITVEQEMGVHVSCRHS